MKTIATNDNNDIFIDAGGNIAIYSDIAALANISKNAVLTNSAELEFNTEKGIPYMETVFSDNVNTDIFQANIIRTLEALEGVERVSSFTYELKDGIYSYSVQIITELGTVVVNG